MEINKTNHEIVFKTDLIIVRTKKQKYCWRFDKKKKKKRVLIFN